MSLVKELEAQNEKLSLINDGLMNLSKEIRNFSKLMAVHFGFEVEE